MRSIRANLKTVAALHVLVPICNSHHFTTVCSSGIRIFCTYFPVSSEARISFSSVQFGN